MRISNAGNVFKYSRLCVCVRQHCREEGGGVDGVEPLVNFIVIRVECCLVCAK